MMALHLGGFPSMAGPACTAVVTTVGAPSFLREASSLRPVAYPTHSVPTTLRVVSNQTPFSESIPLLFIDVKSGFSLRNSDPV